MVVLHWGEVLEKLKRFQLGHLLHSLAGIGHQHRQNHIHERNWNLATAEQLPRVGVELEEVCISWSHFQIAEISVRKLSRLEWWRSERHHEE